MNSISIDFSVLVVLVGLELAGYVRSSIVFPDNPDNNPLPTEGATGVACATALTSNGRCSLPIDCPPYRQRYLHLNGDNVRFLQQENGGCAPDDTNRPYVCCPLQDTGASDHGRTTIPRPTVTTLRHTTTQPLSTVQRTWPTTTLVTKTPARATTMKRTTTRVTTTKGVSTRPRDECGISDVFLNRIVGGYESQINQWPWMAAIYINFGDPVPGGQVQPVSCGGALIGPKFVVTAAHCCAISGPTDPRKASDFKIVLGALDVNAQVDKTDPVTVGVTAVHPHPDYDKDKINNDICLLELDKAVKYTPGVRAICLPPASECNSTFDGLAPYIAGWGTMSFHGSASSVLRFVQLNDVVTNADCKKAFKAFNIDIGPTKMCVTSPDNEKDACQGDSGGPLMLPDENFVWEIIGVISVGFKCAQKGYPGIYTRVPCYVTWIQDTMDNGL